MSESEQTGASASRIKGVAFREFLRWYAGRHGGKKLISLVEGLPSADARLFDPDMESLGVLAAAWYPAPVIHRMLDRLRAGMTEAEQTALAGEVARAVMGTTLKGIYARLMAMFVTPQIYARFADRLWGSYFDTGLISVTIVDPTTADCTVRDWAAHHPLICSMNAEAATSIYAAMGLSGVGTRRCECVAEGGAQCRYITTWEKKLGR